jgi:hypothetical protein
VAANTLMTTTILPRSWAAARCLKSGTREWQLLIGSTHRKTTVNRNWSKMAFHISNKAHLMPKPNICDESVHNWCVTYGD